ncbi:MAG: exodeoxyribonuclease V subunit gamma [Simkaniaceae bacterium]|nr:exodeoxyribonuclease V subunit gamma [Candidatus Sacchlamyda saccharinae]
MTKGQIHFSNDLHALLPILQENLYPEGLGPFEKRLIIVPHLKLKTTLMQALAKEMHVAAGLQIVNLNQGLAKVAKKKLPSSLELSLFLQHELLPLIEGEEALQRYFTNAKEKRIGPFCTALAKYFLRYAAFGKNPLPKWQETLWQKWNFEMPKLGKTKWKIHLFGFSFLPESYFSFFAGLDAKFYFFSPCEIFWGDFYSKNEKSFLRKKVPDAQLEFFDQSFDEQNPLLTSLGKIGRKMHLMAEDTPALEHYIEPAGNTCLRSIQRDLLSGGKGEWVCDPSLAFSSASSLMHEAEIVRDQIYRLLETTEPKEIQVFAPDIAPYVPYIKAVFDDLPHAISDIPRIEEDTICGGFAKMLELPKKRFALDAVCEVLSHFDLDLSLVRRWLEKANVNWGFSRGQRKTFYLQDALEIHAESGEGTFEEGINALLYGLGHLEGLQAIGQADIGEFNRFYQTIHSLVDDLAPLYDATKWTIPTWLRYFACLLECYFPIDPTYDLYKEFIDLAASLDHLDQEKVPFEGVERVLENLFNKKCKSHQPPHLQAIRFASLAEGVIEPSKAIFLLGMQEDHFPRKEEKASLYMGEKAFRPTSSATDHYLLLQALTSAKTFFSVSYQREGALSLVVQELLQTITNAKVSHPKRISPLFSSEKKAPLIPSFYEPTALKLDSLTPMEIDIKKLFKFAKHPLRYYLHEILGIYPNFKQENQKEFLLDPLSKHILVRAKLANQESDLPLPSHLLRPLADLQIETEVEEWKEAMEAFGIKKIESKHIDIQVGPVRLYGTCEFFSEQGLLVRGKNTLEDQIRFLPQGLLMKHLGLPLLFTKDHSTFTPTADLEKYLAYFQLAQKHPSPLVPALAKALLQKSAFKPVEDEIFAYLNLRDPLPDNTVIKHNWSPLLQQVLGGALAEV